MSIPLILITVACYAGTGIDQMIDGKWAWGLFWMCYAVANIAYLLATKGAS